MAVRRETERKIEKLVDELDRVHVEEEVRSAKLSSMVENIKEQAVLIKSYESILNNTKRRVSVFSGIVLNIAIIFIVAWFVNYCFSFFGGFGWWLIDKTVIGLLTLMTWFGFSRLRLRSALANWMTRLVMRLIINERKPNAS